MTAHPLRPLRSASSRSNLARQRDRAARGRKLLLEKLEDRALLAALPYGAYPQDNGEYMLGDVRVTVVLLESDPGLAPRDNLPVGGGGIGALAENWTASAINAVKSNVQAGMDWWRQTLDALPNVRDGLLSFSYDFTYADNPIQTGYEAIARRSDDFALWIYDFLNQVGFNQTGNFSSDIHDFNNFQRQQANADWAFTIFVVNNAADQDDLFAPSSSFPRAFSYAGGQFMVIPSDRPASTYAHEAGHMFWALDEYAGGGTFTARRGYYNSPNTNAWNNSSQGFAQQTSIMANGTLLDDAFAGKVTSTSSKEMIGWKDTDGDGIFDVLDVPFTLTGTGRYDPVAGRYRFLGSSRVNTLPNHNNAGLVNDITINRIRQVEYSIDGGTWTVAQTFADRTYTTNLDLSIPVPAGEHTIRIRTVDTRTGVMSPEFVGTTTVPKSTTGPGASGFVFRDDDADGTWDASEPAMADWAVNLVDSNGAQVLLRKGVEPSDPSFGEGTVLNTISPGVTITGVGSDTLNTQVTARSSFFFPSAGRVFYSNAVSTGSPQELWNWARKLRVDFATPVTTVSIRALSSGIPSIGRLEAYDAAGNLLGRYTTATLTANKSELMSISRPTAEIAYVVAYGHASTEVVLDGLTFGPAASATTNAQGAWSLPNLPAGDYRVKVALPAGYGVTTVGGGTMNFPVASGQVVADVNFGLTTQSALWRNSALPENVTADTLNLVNAQDLLAVINWIMANPGNPSLPTSGNPAAVGFVDVDGNGLCNASDLLAVINYIIAHPLGGSGEGESQFPEGAAPQGEASGEGEATQAVPRTAAEYYATKPLHFAEIPGTNLPCCCSACLAPAHTDEIESLAHSHVQPPAAESAASIAPGAALVTATPITKPEPATFARGNLASSAGSKSLTAKKSAANLASSKSSLNSTSQSRSKPDKNAIALAAEASQAAPAKSRIVRRGARR
jgi:hypothetical protein